MLTREQAKEVKTLLCTGKFGRPVVLFALSYVNLQDDEREVLMLRYLHGLTQEATAEKLNISPNTIYNKERIGLEKCYTTWRNNSFMSELLDAALN